jgi:hypothetical protein
MLALENSSLGVTAVIRKTAMLTEMMARLT